MGTLTLERPPAVAPRPAGRVPLAACPPVPAPRAAPIIEARSVEAPPASEPEEGRTFYVVTTLLGITMVLLAIIAVGSAAMSLYCSSAQ